MALTRDQVRANLIRDMTVRFPERGGVFPEKLKIASLGFPSDASRREWGKKVNQSPWYTGWFTPSEFLACVTLGKDPEGDPNNKNKNLIDLMFTTQTRPLETTAATRGLVAAPAPTARMAKPKAKPKPRRKPKLKAKPRPKSTRKRRG